LAQKYGSDGQEPMTEEEREAQRMKAAEKGNVIKMNKQRLK